MAAVVENSNVEKLRHDHLQKFGRSSFSLSRTSGRSKSPERSPRQNLRRVVQGQEKRKDHRSGWTRSLYSHIQEHVSQEESSTRMTSQNSLRAFLHPLCRTSSPMLPCFERNGISSISKNILTLAMCHEPAAVRANS